VIVVFVIVFFAFQAHVVVYQTHVVVTTNSISYKLKI